MQNTNCIITGSCSCAIPTPAPTSTPTPTPIPTYSISGKIFNDVNSDTKSIGDSNYTGAIAITRLPASGSYSSPVGTGNYSFNSLPSGQYAITYSGLPAGYSFTYPTTPGNSLIVNVGAGCSVPITSEASCSSGNIINLNSGVTNLASAWFQSAGSDMRWDAGFTNILPSGKYASIPGTGGMPGVIFSGKTAPFFGNGQASPNPFNWQVGSFSYPDVFTDTHNLIYTSYRFLLDTVNASAIAKKGAESLCSNGDAFNCAWNANVEHGVYWINSDLNLNGSGYAFPPNQNYVILINGNLNINEKISVPNTSTVIFSAKGNITVDRSIGEQASSANPTIQGLYSADVNFIADGANSCPTVDLRLNIAGTVVANAGRGIGGPTGTFINNRTLCANNSSYPSVSFIERPDFMLHYPSLSGYIPRAWQNVAP
ncbi:MAG: hypothetical protein HYW62_01450 [Candidatus Levybacteria bacterium]|nr:hypothetical protein [Candidatus Levybacteria bacterium]